MSSPTDKEPLLPPPVTASSSGSSPRTRLSARRISSLGLSDKAKGKQRATDIEAAIPDSIDSSSPSRSENDAPSSARGPHRSRSTGAKRRDDDDESPTQPPQRRGRCVTIIFSNESEVAGGNLEVWVEEGESVGKVKDQIRALRPALAPLSLRLIHSGRLLTDGILLLPWLRSLEDRIKRQAAGMGGELESVLKEVGLSDNTDGDDAPVTVASANSGGRASDASPKTAKPAEEPKVWLHCNVGPRMDVKDETAEDESAEEPAAPRRRGFDALLDAGLSAEDVAQMRRQFYESRGEEVPENLGSGDVNDEHARALEEQWIEGDLTAETATTTSEGMFMAILHGLLTGFLIPILPLFFFRETPMPNFFDAEAEAIRQAMPPKAEVASSGAQRGRQAGPAEGEASSSAVTSETRAQPAQTPEMELLLDLTSSDRIGSEIVPSSIFNSKSQMGITLGLVINIAFGALRFLN